MRRLGIKDLPRIVLGLYLFCMLNIVAAIAVVLLFSKASIGNMLGLFLVATGGFILQVVFIWGIGARDLCQPIGGLRLFLPTSIGALLMALMVAGVCVSLGELFRFEDHIWYGPALAVFPLCAIAFVFWARLVPRFGAMGRMGILILLAGTLEIMVAGVSCVITSERLGHGPMASIYAVEAGVFVLAWVVGVGIVWLLFLLPRYLEEKHSRESTRIPGQD